jgi:hypothetical protein
VTQPLLQDASVTLTARISLSGVSDTKTFPITVKAQMTEADAVAAAKAALAITYASGDSAASVTQNQTLPATGIDNSTITWASNNHDVVSIAGAVTQPANDTGVILTATIIVGSASDTKAFSIMVKGLLDAQATVVPSAPEVSSVRLCVTLEAESPLA